MTKYSDYYYYTNQIIVSQNLQQRCDLLAALFFCLKLLNQHLPIILLILK